MEHLLGEGITAGHLNDDRLGRLLDQLFEYGTTLFFLKAAMQAVRRFGVRVSQCHLDSTSFALDGEYASESGTELGYQWQATLERTAEYEAQYQQRHRRFILATNVLDEDAYPAERLLREYKAQQQVERGFRFLKAPLFFTSSVFVKKPQRVEALALIMALTLLVYSLGQRQLRAQLAQADDTVLDQKQRPTRTPTFRWILQKFQAIHLVSTGNAQQVSNLSDERRKIIRLMGFSACQYYLLN